MNIGLHKRPRLATILTTVYFIGVLISACVLYMLQFELSDGAVWITYRIVGVTFFIGIISIYFTARSRDERIVYLDQKKDEEIVAENKTSSLLEDFTLSGNPQNALNEICQRLNAGQAAIYAAKDDNLELKYGYALPYENMSISYKFGEGLVGRVAAEGKSLYLDQLPEGYITVFSGLGNSSPKRLALVPVKSENKVKGVLEIATFTDINEPTLRHLEESAGAIASTIY